MEMVEHKAKSLHEIENYIRTAINLQLSGKETAIPYLQGAPGAGKTAIINEWAKKYNWNILSIHFALLPIEEVSGIPLPKKVISNGVEYSGTEWTMPGIISNLYEFDQTKPTLLFLDDFHLCSPDHLNLGFEMFTNRSIHGFKIPSNVAFILAGNASSKAGSKTGNSAIINRCSINPVKMDFNYWKTNFAKPKGINLKILSFLSNDKNNKYFHGDEMINKPWASPRSWTRLSEVLTELETFGDITYTDLLYYTEAHVGSEAATEFAAYYKFYMDVEMDKIFAGIKNIEVPSDMSGQYIYMLAAVDQFGRIMTDTAYEVLAKISVAIAKKNVSISTVGAKEIASSFEYSVWEKYTAFLKKESKTYYTKISNEITLV